MSDELDEMVAAVEQWLADNPPKPVDQFLTENNEILRAEITRLQAELAEVRDKALDEAAGEVSRQKWSDTIITACDRDGDEGPRWFNDACDECEKAIRALKSRSHTLSDMIASTADEYMSPKPQEATMSEGVGG